MKNDIRIKNNEVYLVLNKIKSLRSLDYNVLDKKIFNKIKKYIDIKDDRISLKDTLNIYKK
jgi:hypothetical protein